MPRDIHAVTISDISTFTKMLRKNMQQHDGVPGHTKLLSMIAKAAGYQNYQHLKAASPGTPKTTQNKRLEKALRTFDANGVMMRWPNQTAVQGLCLWAFWARLPARTDMVEKVVNAILQAGNSFGDHALLRRSLIDHRLVTRTKDGKTYRRIEQAPPPEAAALIMQVQRPS